MPAVRRGHRARPAPAAARPRRGTLRLRTPPAVADRPAATASRRRPRAASTRCGAPSSVTRHRVAVALHQHAAGAVADGHVVLHDALPQALDARLLTPAAGGAPAAPPPTAAPAAAPVCKAAATAARSASSGARRLERRAVALGQLAVDEGGVECGRPGSRRRRAPTGRTGWWSGCRPPRTRPAPAASAPARAARSSPQVMSFETSGS